MIDQTIKNILVRGTNWVGDAVMTLPALAALAQNFPESRISVLTKPWAGPIYTVAGEGRLTILDHDKKGRHQGLGGFFKLAGELRKQKFDLAILFQNAIEAAALSFLARAPRRLGYAVDGRGFLLTDPIERTPADRLIHESFYYLNILERAGLKAPFTRPRIKPSPENLEAAEKMLQEHSFKSDDFILALAPGAAFGTAKRWPVENFAQSAELILEQKPGRAIILGGGGEMAAAAELAGLLRVPHLNLAGQTSLELSLAVLSKAGLLVTNDSGLMHLGGALDVPLAAAFGPTNPLTTAPLGRAVMVRAPVACSPCLKRDCPLPHRLCFDGVDSEKMASKALSLLDDFNVKPGFSPAVFLDRDGTINREVNYLSDPDQLELLPGAGEAVARLNRSGFKVVVVSNQSGVARGYFDLETLERVNQRLKDQLEAYGARLDGIYFCPHHPQGTVPELAVACHCRKPSPLLFEKAAAELKIDLKNSFFVGDNWRDLSPAEQFGGRTVLVLTGHGLANAMKPGPCPPNLVAPDLRRAVDWILSL